MRTHFLGPVVSTIERFHCSALLVLTVWLCSVPGHGAEVRSVDWHPYKSLLASGSKDNQQPVKLWDPKAGSSVCTL